MSFAESLSKDVRDSALDDIFKSSAGPSTFAKPSDTHRNANLQHALGGAHEVNKKRTKLVEKDETSSENAAKKRKMSSNTKPERASSSIVEPESLSSSDEQSNPDSEPSVPEHETLTTSKSKRKHESSSKAGAKYAPEDETRETRDARTIFLGNLPVSIIKSKALQKQLRRHILSVVPSAKIDSVRFRSVAFKNPTTKLEETEDEPSTRSTKQSRQLKRAAEWRDQQEAEGSKGSRRDQEEAAEDRKGEKQYMTPAEKRRLAAIKGETHDEAVATTNAYVVFAYRRPSAEGEGANATEGQMDPFAAAQEAAAGLDGTIFAEHAIRADRIGQPQSADRASSATEPRLSVFVGNLDFASSEDVLRAFFEKVLQEERGHRQTGNTLGDGTSAKANGWVSRVRIVRDRGSQLGKGFAYVQFADRDCIDTILALEPEKLTFAKRTLRVQRCKVLTNKAKLNSSSSTNASKSSSAGTTQTLNAGSLPKGDPQLGARLAGLTKDERKAAKAQNSDRVARRLAKKKLRGAADKTGLGDSSKASRKRVRDKKAPKVNPGRKESKKRVRSDRSIQRRNTKK